MKECELCNLPARMYCESDQASLCWDCDSKVHSANFLVARHSRSLLCLICQSPTPWQASGEKLGYTVSVCEKCVDIFNGRKEEGLREEGERENNDDDEDEFDEEDDSDDQSEDENDSDDPVEDDGDDEEDGENQVVPWSSTPPPPVSSSTSSEEESSSINCNRERGFAESSTAFSLKRLRENADLDSPEDLSCPSSPPNNGIAFTVGGTWISPENEATSSNSFRMSIHSAKAQDRFESRSEMIIGSLKRFRQHVFSGDNASAIICDVSKLCKDHNR